MEQQVEFQEPTRRSGEVAGTASFGPRLGESFWAGQQRSLAELEGLMRIAHELYTISMRERKFSKPLRQDTQEVIARSRRLMEESAQVAEMIRQRGRATAR